MRMILKKTKSIRINVLGIRNGFLQNLETFDSEDDRTSSNWETSILFGEVHVKDS
jgi:hypothetical protein